MSRRKGKRKERRKEEQKEKKRRRNGKAGKPNGSVIRLAKL